MSLAAGSHRFDWIDRWGCLQDSASARTNGRPHGVAADPDGHLYVVEWILGGRVTKLARR